MIVAVILFALMLMFGVASRYYGVGYSFYTHLFYIPILIAGLLFGIPGGTFCGLMGGLILGPWMGEDFFRTFGADSLAGFNGIMPQAVSGIEEPTGPWLLRLFFFGSFGAIAGFGGRVCGAHLKTTAPITTGDMQIAALGRAFIHQSAAGCKHVLLILITINDFQKIQALLGPILVSVLIDDMGRRLQKDLTTAVSVSYLGGHQFTVLADHHMTEKALIAAIDAVFQDVFQIKKFALHVTVSCHGACAPEQGKTVECLIQHVHQAQIKSTTPTTDHAHALYKNREVGSARQDALMHGIQYALTRQQLTVLYQPIAALRTGLITGFEATVHWHHPTLGPVPHQEFMPLIEQTQMTENFHLWLLKTVCAQLQSWKTSHPHLTMTLQLPRKSLLDLKNPVRWKEVIASYFVKSQRLILCVSAQIFGDETVRAIEAITAIKEQGFKIMVTDIGRRSTYLLSLPLDMLQLDPAYVQVMEQTHNAAAILKGMQVMAKTRGAGLRVSGLETEHQYESLRDMGVVEGQGLYMSLPLTEAEAQRWLTVAYPLHGVMNLSRHP